MKRITTRFLLDNEVKIKEYLRENVIPKKIGNNIFYVALFFGEEIIITLDSKLEDRTMFSLIMDYKNKEIVFM